MAKTLVSTESGDWFLVPWDKRHDFYYDELEDNEIDYDVRYIGNPSQIKIIEYEYE